MCDRCVRARIVKGGNVNRHFRPSYLRRRFEWVPVNGNRIVRDFLYAAHQADAVLCVCNNGRDSESRGSCLCGQHEVANACDYLARARARRFLQREYYKITERTFLRYDILPAQFIRIKQLAQKRRQ